MKYLYEFIGTFFLVLTVGMTALEPATLFAPLAIGAVLIALVFAGGPVSGAHYNPAVTFAVFFRNGITWSQLGIYFVMQMLGAICAGLLVLFFKDVPVQTLHPQILKAFLAEFLFTFALCFVVCNVATAKKSEGNSYFGLAIGLVVIAGAYAVGSISGAIFNPAVLLGLNVMNFISWSSMGVFLLAQMLAGFCAGFVTDFTHGRAKYSNKGLLDK